MEIDGRPTTTEVAVDPTLPYEVLRHSIPDTASDRSPTTAYDSSGADKTTEGKAADLGNSEPDPNWPKKAARSQKTHQISKRNRRMDVSATEEETTLTDKLPEDMFTEEPKQKTRLTRRQRRQQREGHASVAAEAHPLDGGKSQFTKAQQADETLRQHTQSGTEGMTIENFTDDS